MKKVIISVLILITIFVLTTGCDNESTDVIKTPQREDIVIAQSGEPFGLIPQITNDGYSSRIENQLYSSLVTKDDNDKIVGDIAESWEVSDDFLTYTFRLKKDIQFHNGNKLTPEDVKFTFEIGMKSPQVADLFGVFDSVEVVDDSTVKIVLKHKYAPLLEKLSFPSSSGILCKSSYEEVGEESYNENPIGSGPYKLKSWEKGVRITLESFEQYFKGQAPIKNATIRFIPDPTTATISIESGEIDMTDNVSLVDIEALDTEKVAIYENSSTHFNWLAINTSKTPFNNTDVRKAIEYAVDKEAVITAAVEGHGTLAETIGFEGMLGYSSEIGGNDYNPEKAKELLINAGYGDGFETTILALGGYTSVIAEVVQANLSEVGITVEIQNMEPSAFLQDILSGNYELSYLGSDSLNNDPEQIYHRLHPKGTYSVSHYDNPELNTVLEKIIYESNEQVRIAAVQQVQKIFKQDVPLVPLFWGNKITLAHKDLLNADKMNHRFEIYKLQWK